MERIQRTADGREVRELPCSHTFIENDALEITCPTCGKVYQRVGLRIESPERWRLPQEKEEVRIRL